MAAMHQDTSEDHEVVSEKLKEIFGVRLCTLSHYLLLIKLIFEYLYGPLSS